MTALPAESTPAPPNLMAMNADTGELIDPSELTVAELPSLIGGRCTAHSKQSGNRCKVSSVPGAVVCRFHGGAAPQVIAAAAKRLEEARDLALEKLVEMMESPDGYVDAATLLAVVVKLTEKAELLNGRATSRSEETQLRRTELIRADLEARISSLNVEVIDVRSVDDGDAA